MRVVGFVPKRAVEVVERVERHDTVMKNVLGGGR